MRHPQRVSVAERHHRELSRQRPARLLGGTLDGGGVWRFAAQQQLHQRVAARLRGAFEQGLLARVAGHRGVREAVDVGEDRLGEDDQRARVQGRLGQLPDGPPRDAGADAVRRLQRVERATRAELGPSDRLVDVVVGQVDGAAEQIHELLQRRRRAVAEEPSELTLERLVVLDHLGAHRGDDLLDDAGQPRTHEVCHLGGHGRPRRVERGRRRRSRSDAPRGLIRLAWQSPPAPGGQIRTLVGSDAMAVADVPFDLLEVKLAAPLTRPGTVAKADVIARLCASRLAVS